MAEQITFTCTRESGLQQLARFLPYAGKSYARERNFDNGPEQHHQVSGLSPFIRRRLITEQEVAQKILSCHSFQDAEKFISEIYWRTYFKGWLEQRPSVWTDWLEGAVAMTDKDKADYQIACQGKTDIACFDFWANELRQTGYLHNHARMWFASVWIFTLKLDWQWGARFFMQWLKDGDPASNILSWRWVAGLHTKGRHYLARADNIETFTRQRFAPYGQLMEQAEPIAGPDHPVPELPGFPESLPETPYIFLITAEDGHLESLSLSPKPAGIIVLPASMGNMYLKDGSLLRDSSLDRLDQQAMHDTASRAAVFYQCPVLYLEDNLDSEQGFERLFASVAGQISDYAAELAIQNLSTTYLPTGIWRDNLYHLLAEPDLSDFVFTPVTRAYDKTCWPSADKGFFAFKQNIPKWISQFD